MNGYIDLHLHLLPGVDDGPQSREEALELARELVADGVEKAAVTPHFNAWDPERLSSKAAVDDHLSQLQERMVDSGITLELYPGAEHFLTPEMVEPLRAGTLPALADGPYVLVELPFGDKPLYADDLLFQVSMTGRMPVLAHPERYAWVQSSPASVVELVERGLYLQLTAPSLSGHYGAKVRKTAEELLRLGAYSVVGSDRHRPGQRRQLSEMEPAVISVAGTDTAQVLFRENPGRILLGRPLLAAPAGEALEPKKRLFGLFG